MRLTAPGTTTCGKMTCGTAKASERTCDCSVICFFFFSNLLGFSWVILDSSSFQIQVGTVFQNVYAHFPGNLSSLPNASHPPVGWHSLYSQNVIWGIERCLHVPCIICAGIGRQAEMHHSSSLALSFPSLSSIGTQIFYLRCQHDHVKMRGAFGN